MIALYTDFGMAGPYLGQVEEVIYRDLPQEKVINLLADAPKDPTLAGYLLAALRHVFEPGTVFLTIVDPGVGGHRMAVILKADEHYFIGPDNGLLNTVAKQSQEVSWWEIDWRPEKLSASFHGRDLFAPAAVRLLKNDLEHIASRVPGPELDNWPADLAQIIYFDHYGNAMTGLRYQPEMDGKYLQLPNQKLLSQGKTFSSVKQGEAFWYCNSCGLVEIAVNQGRADQLMGVALGVKIKLI